MNGSDLPSFPFPLPVQFLLQHHRARRSVVFSRLHLLLLIPQSTSESRPLAKSWAELSSRRLLLHRPDMHLVGIIHSPGQSTPSNPKPKHSSHPTTQTKRPTPPPQPPKPSHTTPPLLHPTHAEAPSPTAAAGPCCARKSLITFYTPPSTISTKVLEGRTNSSPISRTNEHVKRKEAGKAYSESLGIDSVLDERDAVGEGVAVEVGVLFAPRRGRGRVLAFPAQSVGRGGGGRKDVRATSRSRAGYRSSRARRGAWSRLVVVVGRLAWSRRKQRVGDALLPRGRLKCRR